MILFGKSTRHGAVDAVSGKTKDERGKNQRGARERTYVWLEE